jgi:hypothetical protein
LAAKPGRPITFAGLRGLRALTFARLSGRPAITFAGLRGLRAITFVRPSGLQLPVLSVLSHPQPNKRDL